MKFIIFALLSSALVSASSFAAGKNLVVCSGQDSFGGPIGVVIHQDVGGQLVGLLTTESTGGSEPTLAYKVQYVRPPIGNLGAGLTFAGNKLSLHVNTDGPGQPFAGFLTVVGLAIKNERVSCKVH